ncbi:hypothetical protein [Proteiniphilum sp.]|uniref:hypothetical protein n=1 Tax=Proteiniphilum sp. TaxID=1926877 RepID=UPI003325C576
MSLKIKNKNGEIFDLPVDYVIEAEKNNPLFTNKGSKTVPIHFPDTNNNRKLLNNTNRLDKAERPEPIPVVVETDASQQSGLMVINSGFNAGIGFDESEMYNRMSSMLLKDLPNLPSFSAGGSTTSARVNSMLSHLTAVMKEQIEADYFVFPVCLDYQSKFVPEPVSELKKYYIILNEVERVVENPEDPNNWPHGRMAELLALNHRTLSWYIDGEEVYLDVPKGYGVSPFIKVYRILELIFDHFGFIIDDNPFKDHRQLKKLVVLNNTMDAILTGTLYYKDMMPDITIKSFLDGLYNKFGMQYSLNSNARTVSLKFLKDTLIPMKLGSVGLDNFKTEEPTITYSSPKQLKLIANRELDKTKTLFDTYEEFLQANNHEFTEVKWSDNTPVAVTSRFQTFWSRYFIGDALGTQSSFSSDFFDWDKKDPELDYEEIKMDDLCVPLDSVLGQIYPHYLVNYKHAYSDINVSGELFVPEVNPAKLAFVFGWGKTNRSGNFVFNYYFASQINRDENGDFIYDQAGEKYDISLTINREDGLFNRFWKEYDAFLRYSNFEVKCKLKLSDADIFNFDMFKTAIINNQPLLPKQIKYKLNQEDAITECTFQTLRLYEPYNLEEEQKIPVYISQKYYWSWTDVKVPNTEQEWTDEEIEYWIISGQTLKEIIIDEVPYPTKQIAMLPPTEEQFQNQEHRVFIYDYVIFRLPIITVQIRQTVTYVPAIINY